MTFSRRWLLPVTGLTLLLPTLAPALVINDDTPVSDYLAAATATPLSATGGFFINGNFESSGVLVAPNVVVGAAHTAASASAAGRTFRLNGLTYTVASATRLDNNTNATDGRDTALFTLTTPVLGVAPAPLYTGSLADTVGLTAFYTGLGDRGTGSAPPTTPATDPDGLLLAGQNVIEAAGLTVSDGSGGTTTFSNNIVFSDFDDGTAATNQLGSITQLDLEMGLAIGDSGGGVFVFNTLTGRYELAALHSFVLGDDFGYGSISASTGFNPADLATLTAAIPEPGSAAALLLGLTALARGRRRS